MNFKMALSLSLILASCSHFKHKQEEPILPNSLEEAVSSSFRDEENSDRDEYQHPKETLDFFGISPQMTVVEISPGAGYYTEILAPYLAREGQYVIVSPRLPSHPPAFLLENERKLQDILLRHQEVQAKTKFVPFEPMNKRNSTKPAFADMVLTFGSVHNWVATQSTGFAFKFFYDVLKPGGILGVVQHRIAPGKKNFPKSGYMTENEVIALARKAGFKFVGKSEINANPKDEADYPAGVWTLPPTLRLGDKDRRHYERIGESDRMTLKFRK
jgi:predicted methyltransferase